MNENQTKLNELIGKLSAFDTEFLELGGAILKANNQSLYAMDLFSTAVVNRSIQLLNGFLTLISVNNYLCAIPLIRLQLDNALRFFATSIVKNRNDFVLYFLDGNSINSYKDKNNKYLSDRNLATKLDSFFPGVLQIYQNISGHIHLSDQHFFALKEQNADKSKPTRIAIGRGVDPFSPELKINFTSTMIEVSKLVTILVNQWRIEKENIKSKGNDL